MSRIVDIVNFNADASCLTSRHWLESLSGGKKSDLCRWLSLYVDHGKKISLGLTGATIADMAVHNPESLDLIRRNREIFEVLLRPFAHDIALLRSRAGFEINFRFGKTVIEREFDRVAPFFLPPEFMLTGEQISILREEGARGVFINSKRFSPEVEERIPVEPYMVRGTEGSLIGCFPCQGVLTRAYLDALHRFEFDGWNRGIQKTETAVVYVWRDGESPFFTPGGLRRERMWLENEDSGIERIDLAGGDTEFVANETLEEYHYKSYPPHSFSAWVKEMRMLGYLQKVSRIEEILDRLTPRQIFYWLMVINSDILSSIEKPGPVFELKKSPESLAANEYKLYRSNRGFEGEEYLMMLDREMEGNRSGYAETAADAHVEKLRGRIAYLERMSG
jgi:hypothetical protein